MKSNIRQLSLNDSNTLKGIALLLLLIHHLFYIQKGLYNDIQLIGKHCIVNEIGIFSKVCVAIFVFLSGYGLTVKAEQERIVPRRFYIVRLTKLILNFWFVWLFFVPIHFFHFNYTLQDIYGSYVIPKLLLDCFGLLHIVGVYGINPTWWFYSTIIILYLLYPFLYKLSCKPCFLIICALLCSFCPVGISGVNYYILPFILGIITCRFPVLEGITPPINLSGIIAANAIRNIIFSIFAVIVFLLLFIERMVTKVPILFDSIIVLVILSLYLRVKLPAILSKILTFLGRHSMNIFLFHTFIFGFWFEDFIYSSRNPIIIFLLLLSICIVISETLERIKILLNFKGFVSYISNTLCQTAKE